MKRSILLAVFALVGLLLLSPSSGSATHGGSHTCAINAEQAGSNPSPTGIWAYDFRLTNEGGTNVTDYAPPNGSYKIKGVCLYTVNGDQFQIDNVGSPPHYSSDGCYRAMFDEPGTLPNGLRVYRYGSQPPCENLSYMDVLIGGFVTFKQGDITCGGTVNSVDALFMQRFAAGLETFQDEPCPEIGMTWFGGKKFGDVDCSGSINSVDSLKTLRYVSGLSVSQAEPCVDIGANLPSS